MTVLVANVVHETELGFVEVENRLPPGQYRFRLTVFDEARNESQPTFLVVTVNEMQFDPKAGRRVDPAIVERDIGSLIERLGRKPVVGDVARPIDLTLPRRPKG
jgi:hypothetical protein